MSRRGRLKRDKWRDELAHVEAEHNKWYNKVMDLQHEQEELQAREILLLQMIHLLGLVANAIEAYIKQQQQQWEFHTMQDQCSKIGSNDTMQLLHNAHYIDERIEQQLLQLVDSSSISSRLYKNADHQERVDLLLRILSSDNVQQVLSMSAADMVQLLCHLAGQCAIQCFQGDAAVQYWHPPLTAAAAASTACSSSSTGSSSTSDTIDLFVTHPAFKFISIFLCCMFFNPVKCNQLKALLAEAQAAHYQLPAMFWQHVAEKLALNDDQVRRLILLRNLTIPKISVINKKITHALQQQEAISDAQLMQLQQLSLGDNAQQQQPPHHALKQLRSDQECIVAKQESNVAGYAVMAMNIGIGSLAILTPKQYAFNIAASYPSHPRMDLLLTAVENLPRYQTHKQQQRQQQQAQQQTKQQKQKQRVTKK